MDLWQTILGAFVGNALLLAALAFLARSLLAQLLAKDLAKFQAELKAASDTAAAELAHRLTLVAHERQVRFSKLHERRADALDDIFQQLVAFEDAASPLAMPSVEPIVQEPEFRAAETAFTLLAERIKRHRIYLPSATCLSLDSMLENIQGMLAQYSFTLLVDRLEKRGLQHGEAALRAWANVNAYLDIESPKVRAQIEAEFRALLGGGSDG